MSNAAKGHDEKKEAISDALTIIRQDFRTEIQVLVAKNRERFAEKINDLQTICDRLMTIQNRVARGDYGTPHLVCYDILRAVEDTNRSKHVVVDLIATLA